mgnify:CR=1 FL=1
MLRLITFGGLALMHGETVLRSHTPRQRLLPLLALVAAAGPRGVPRDRMAALLWPDSEPPRARHSLEEVVFQLRKLARLAGHDDVFADAPVLLLDRARLAADVWEFEAALDRSELERAVSVCGGRRFAADVAIDGCDELDRRLSALREHYEREQKEVLERLARRAAEVGDRDGQLRWRQQLVALDPGDRRATLALVDALEARQEPARACAVAERHQRHLAELGLARDAELELRIRQLRVRPAALPATPAGAFAEFDRAPAAGGGMPAEEDGRRLERALAPRYVPEGAGVRGSFVTSVPARETQAPRARVTVHVIAPGVARQADPHRFVETMRRVAALRHPRILPVLDGAAREELLLFVTPRPAGGSLRRRLQAERPLPLDEAIAITHDLAAALAHAHEHGVAHGDLRPKHVHLDGGDGALVGFFGVVDAIAGTQPPGDEASYVVSFGEKAYQSPEQMRHAVVTSPRSDVYAVGAIVHEMLVGEAPFATRSAVDVGRKFTHAPERVRTRRERVPEPLDELVARCLARVPADRFASGVELARALAELVPVA